MAKSSSGGVFCRIEVKILDKVRGGGAIIVLTEWKTRFPAAVFEQFGQIFYVYALADNPIIAAPMIASYCIISAILSRIFLKEKLKASQYACIAAVVVGIIIIGISDGIKEA